MSLSREHSRDEPERVTWPHLETHWRPQQSKSPHRVSKKAGNLRSHSWWWDSHISPKSSKWLQENLAEMDSKVNAMLKIIEEDADSFAKRAEMFYKRRPELVSLVEEFYRTYRALVERHAFLTKELRQNIAPALHAQFTGAAYEFPSNSPGDPLVTHGSDRFDIASLSSHSFPEALEFEDDSQSEFSAKSSKGDVDEEDASPQNSRGSFETRDLEFQPFALSSEEEHLRLQHSTRAFNGLEDSNSSIELKNSVQILEDEKKYLTAQLGEGHVKIKDLQSEVSSLLSESKALEAEEKLAKGRLNDLLHLKQTLEAENLKLTHALITCKEEKTQLMEAQDRSLQEVLASRKRVQELEKDIDLLHQKTATSHAEVMVGQEQVKRFEDGSIKPTTQERNQRDAMVLDETFEKRLQGFHMQIIDLEEENGALKEQSATRTAKLRELNLQLVEVNAAKEQLEQELLRLQRLKETLELEYSTSVLKVGELGGELEAAQRNNQELLEQAMQKDEQLSKLERTIGDGQEHRARLESEKDELLNSKLQLETESKELQEARDSILAESQHHASQCKAMEAVQAQLNEQLTSLMDENKRLQEGKMAMEGMLVKANLEVKELHSSLNAISTEKMMLLQRAYGKVDASEREDDQLLQKPVLETTHFRDLEVALSRIMQENNMLGKREAEALQSLLDLEKASQAQISKLEQTVDEYFALIAERDINLTDVIKQSDLFEKQRSEAQLSNSRLEETLSLLEAEKGEAFKLVDRLCAEVEELKNSKDRATAKCQLFEEECKALKTAEERLRALLADKVAECTSLQDDKSALEGELAKVCLQMEKLQINTAGMCKEKDALSEKFAVCSAHAIFLQNELDKCKEFEGLQNADVQKHADTIRSMEVELKDLHLSVSKSEERNNALICEQKKSLDEISYMCKKVQGLEEEVSHLAEEKVSLVKDHEEQNGRLQNQLQNSNNMAQSLEAELLKLHNAISPSQEANSFPIGQQLRSFDSGLIMPDRITHIHHKVGSLLEERALLLNKVSHHQEQRDEIQSRVQSLQRDKDALQAELKREQQAVFEARRNMEKLLDQIEDVRKQEHKKDVEVLELSAFVETLKQSLLARDLENSKLSEELSKSADCQIESEKNFMEEISFLQSEEMKWRNEVTTNSALMAEKVACLRMENAALHEDLSLKLELLLKLEKDVESLVEERSSLSQTLQAMAAKMQEYKDDLQMFKEFVIPSLEERVGELQGEITDLTISNEAHVAHIVSMRKQLNDAFGELLRLHDVNATFEIELLFNVEMLKHMSGILSAIKVENSKLFDKLGSQEKHSQMQEQLLVKASYENEALSKRLLAVEEERNGLKAEVENLIAMLVELQRELAASRQDNGLVRSPGSPEMVSSISNSDRNSMDPHDSIHAQMRNVQNIPLNTEEPVESQMHHSELATLGLEPRNAAFSCELQRPMEGLPLAGLKAVNMSDLEASKEGNHGSLKASVLLVGMLKEEIVYLQDEIRRLQLPTAGQDSGTATKEGGAQEIMDDVQRLKEENCSLVEEINSLKSQSLTAWMENNLIENSVRDLQSKLTLLQEQNRHLCSDVSSSKENISRLEEECHSLREKNGHLDLEVSSCKADIDRLGGECHSLEEQNAELQQDRIASLQGKKKSEEAMHMLEDVMTSLEQNNRRLQAENESVKMEMEKLNSTVSCLHNDGSELMELIKVKLTAALEQVKLMMDDCGREIGPEPIVQIMKDIEQVHSSPHVHVRARSQRKGMTSADQRRVQEAMTELETRSILILAELQERAEETDIILEFIVFIRKMLGRFLDGEHTCPRVAPNSPTYGNLEGEQSGDLGERSIAIINDEIHIKLAERLHQAGMDERLEHELLELKEGRKQLKEEMEVRLAEVQRMESELKKFQVLLEQDEYSKGARVERGEKMRRNVRGGQIAKELRDMLAEQRRHLGRMLEVMSGEEQQEAAAENQVTVLVSMESVTWDDEQVNVLSRQLENMRGLNRKHSAELQTIGQVLQSMGSTIKDVHDLLLLGSPQDGEEEIISMADLRTQTSSVIDLRTPDNRVSVDSTLQLRTPDNRVSVDSTQQLLSPSPCLDGGDSVSARGRGSSQFALKPRNFGLTWFLLLFSPDRKPAGLGRSKSNKPWDVLKPIRRGRSGSTERKNAAACWTCVSNTNRVDSFAER